MNIIWTFYSVNGVSLPSLSTIRVIVNVLPWSETFWIKFICKVLFLFKYSKYFHVLLKYFKYCFKASLEIDHAKDDAGEKKQLQTMCKRCINLFYEQL